LLGNIIVSGEVAISAETENQFLKKYITLHSGDFFVGLMTGKPRATNAIAQTEVECYCLNKETFEKIIHSNPQLIQEISDVMISRHDVLEPAFHKAQGSSKKHLQHSKIVEHIRQFFGLNNS
jgi:CRP-like cAMP-binding protein